MNIKIIKTLGNNLDEERVVFSVTEDDFLGSYIVFKTKKISEKTISSKVEEIYWFPDKEVKKGDLVVLYTKRGTNTEKKNTDGTTTHFYYWYLNNRLWNSSEDAAVLSRLENWDFKSAVV